MPADVDIANLALSKVGAQRILTLQDNNKAARTINAIYALERDTELSAHFWNFAMARISLPALTTPPAFDYSNAFQLPDDYLTVFQVGKFYPGQPRSIGIVSPNQTDYKIEGRTIVTSQAAPLPVRYVRRVTDPNLFHPCFVEAFACALAMKIAEDLTGVGNKRQLAQGEYKAAISIAMRTNAIELPPDPLPDHSWLLSRLPG
jgi:hypothetical protein